MVQFSSKAKGIPGEVRQLTQTKQQNIDKVGVVIELSESYLSWKNSSCHFKEKNTFLVLPLCDPDLAGAWVYYYYYYIFVIII